MPPLTPFARWRASDDLITAAMFRRRRADLGVWGDEPVCLENSGVDGAMRLVAWREGSFVSVSPGDEPVGSSLYGYGAPAWAALTGDTLVGLASDATALWVMTRSPSSAHRIELGPSRAAGYVRRINDSCVVVVTDLGEPHGRVIELVGLDGTRRVVYNTTSFIGDLVVSADGARCAWVEWAPSTMPWEGAVLRVASTDADHWTPTSPLGEAAPVAQPLFVGSDLYFSFETSEWSTPHRWDGREVFALDAPVGEYRADWLFGRAWIAATSAGVLLGSVLQSRARTGWWTSDDDFVHIEGGPQYLYEVCAVGECVVAIGSTSTDSSLLWRCAAGATTWTCLEDETTERFSGGVTFQRTSLGTPFVLCEPTSAFDLDRPGLDRPGLDRPGLDRPGLDRPGLVVMVHGGPTAYASFEFQWLKELFCASGLAVASVDYRGSSSYGRTYRRALNGHWGERDVDDVVDVIDHVVASGRVDPARVFVRGSSAGALTALLASASPHVRGVVALSAVSDVSLLSTLSDEVERAYVATLVGTDALSAGAARRSPVERANELAPRALIMHGAEDHVVAPRHAETLATALRGAGREVTLEFFAGEGHSIRRPAAYRRSLVLELDFYTSGAMREGDGSRSVHSG